jgi:thymidylate synthase
MSFHVSLDSLESIHSCLMGTLLDDPDCESAPRGKPVRELIAASFTLTNPRNRLVLSPARAVNYGFGVGELCWYVRGDRDLATMRYYNKRMSQFSDDGETINSAYGNRIFRPRWEFGSTVSGSGYSQFDNVVDELKADPHSRRAVIHINEPYDLRHAVLNGSKDVPCTMSLQLLIRDRRLHMHALMRSNDVVWGMPYDVFSFTSLQEAFLYTLQDEGVPVDDLGCYHHTAGSLHLYDTHYGMAGLVGQERMPDPAPMAPFTLDGLRVLADEDEPAIRAEGWADVLACPRPSHDVDSISWMHAQLIDHWNKRQKEREIREQQT